MDIYTAVIRPLLFSWLSADPEQIHQQTMRLLHWLNAPQSPRSTQWLRQQLHHAYSFTHPSLEQTLWNCHFANPIGLAAGFDKDGVAANVWADFGFGFAELGTVTFHAQPGNPKPRLFRLPLDRAALNRMGFNNQGAAVMAERLAATTNLGQKDFQVEGRGQKAEGGREIQSTAPQPQATVQPVGNLSTNHSRSSAFLLGINLGKSKITPLEAAAEDYLSSFRLLKPWGDYFVVNVSSPNTPGLRSLQAVEQLEPILAALQQENQNQKPLLVKIAPDLEWEDIAAIVHLAQAHHLSGIIATNTTIRREQLKTQTLPATGKPVREEAGGISGAPVRQRSTEVIRFIYQQTQGQLPIIGVGGVFTAEDAWEKITAGASLVQVYTGWIYEGPWMVKRILKGLVCKLEAQGMTHIKEAVGTNLRS